MFEKGLLAGKRILVTGGGSGLGAAMGRRFVELGAELIICGRRLELLEATAAQMRSDFGGKVAAVRCDIRDGAAVEAMMDAIWREAPLDVLVNNAAATFIAQTEHLSFRAADAILAPTLHGTMYCTLGCRQTLDRGRPQGRGAEHPVDLDHHRPRLHGAVGDGEVGDPCDDQKPRGGVGTEGHPHGGDRARRVSDRGRIGPASARRPRRRWASRNPLGRVGEHSELADLASFLISDPGRLHQWRDGGAGWRRAFAQFRRRGSAAMDRRAVGEAARRRGRSDESASCHVAIARNCLPKKAFSRLSISRVTCDVGPSSSHND